MPFQGPAIKFPTFLPGASESQVNLPLPTHVKTTPEPPLLAREHTVSHSEPQISEKGNADNSNAECTGKITHIRIFLLLQIYV